MGEKWLFEVRTIRYIVVRPRDIFPRGRGKPLSDSFIMMVLDTKSRIPRTKKIEKDQRKYIDLLLSPVSLLYKFISASCILSFV